MKEVWTTQPTTATEARRAVYILDPAVGIGGSGASKLTLKSGTLKSPSGVFTFEYKGMKDGDTLIFFTTGYASDANMNGRGMDQQIKTILTYSTDKSGSGSFLTTGRFVITQGAIDGDQPTE